jgi:DNA-nicking Smr family endonuclease
MSRRRQLSDEERTLWSSITRSIAPLRPAQNAAKSTAKSSVAKSSAKSSEQSPAKPSATDKAVPSPALPHPIARRATPSPAPSPPLAPLGRRLKQRVARGREPIDARIDLHGLTQRQAHTALLRFLERAQRDGAKTVLVVTGKGFGRRAGAGEPDAASEGGVLRRQVPMWLALPEFRLLIVGFDDAHIGHGGQGALYVRLRRER